MDENTYLIFGGVALFMVLVFYIIIRSAKNRPLTGVSEIVEDQKQPGFYHIFGYITFMPDDSPSFEKYQHLLLDTSTLKVVRGLEQRGSDFDIDSPFVSRCLEHMKTLTGKELQFKEEAEDTGDEDLDDAREIAREKAMIRIVKHERDESDTSIIKATKGNVIDVYDTSYGELNHFALQITLDGLNFAVPKVKGLGDVNHVIWRKNSQKLFIFYNRMVMMKFGAGMLVLDTSSGTVISDNYLKAN